MRLWRHLGWIAVAMIVCLNTAHADSVTRLKQKIAQILARQQLAGAQVGVYARVTDSQRVLFARNADTPMMPASNFKLVTTATALAVLGPGFRFTTEVLGPPVDRGSGTINGNLYLRGTGDPTMVDPWTRPATGPFEQFAEELRKQGVKRVSGALVGDDSAFDRDFVGRGWLRRYILQDYAAETAALSINGNVMSLDVRPNKVIAYPPTATLHYQRISSRGGFSVTRNMDSSCVIIRNSKPGKALQTSMTIHNPSEYTTGVFAVILRHAGIVLGSDCRLINDNELPLPQGLVVYASHNSAPLLKIIKRINKHSDNLFADHVFKAIGYKRFGKGTLDTATRAVKEFMESLGVDTTGMQVADGCGLSVLNHISPRQFVELLEGMSRRADGDVFKSTLAMPGQPGTLSGRLNGLPVMAKTGTIDGTCTLSGYVYTKAGQQVCFSILVNHHHTSNDAVRWMQDEIVKCIAATPERM